MPTQITRLVVLMLENRSFDHMLGFLKKTNPTINGLNGDEWNYPAGEATANIVVSNDAGDAEDLNPDPNHEFAHVTWQISSTGDPVGNPDMKGFVRDYFEDCKDADHAAGIMKCFTPQTLPILSTLATQYAVCDHWFSSVPGSTIPNRLFVHGASSAGSLTQDVIAAPFAVHTIFESFDDTTPHEFAIYTAGSSILLTNKYLLGHMNKFHNYANFVVDATSGNLPAYTFIEPAYDDDGEGTFANSQHPDFPVDRGEELIREIYYALTGSPDWKSTLFLILYSGHGGVFDHVSPPIITRNPIYNHLPDVQHSGPPDVFDFTRLGVRVPAVFVSPCIPPNTVINDRNYDHCSVVSTVRKLFCNPASQPLNWREAQAATFENVLTLTGANIRNDVVSLPEPVVIVPSDAPPIPRAPSDLTVLMAGAMHYALQLQGLRPPGDYTSLTNSAQVAAYLKQANAYLQRARQTSDPQALNPSVGSTAESPLPPAVSVGPSTHVARDRWTTADSLSHYPYAYAIYRFLTDPETAPPLAVSIQAPWGGGKTSLMRMIQTQLDPDALTGIDQTAPMSEKESSSASVKQVLIEMRTADNAPAGEAISAVSAKPSRFHFFFKSSAPELPQPSIPLIDEAGERRVTVWFNAWKYESTAQVWAGLADCIVQQVSKRMGPVERELFWFKLQLRRLDAGKIRRRIHDEILSAFAERVLGWFPAYLGGLVALGFAVFKHEWPLAGSLFAAEFAAGWAQLWKTKSDIEGRPARISLGDLVQAPDYAASLGFVHEVVEDLRRVFELIPRKHLPMVVFIDDLDRCSPGKIAAVVEAINLFLGGEFSECMFILGIDDEMVAAALDMAHSDVISKLPSYARSASVGWRFMDKFVQLPFVIPPPPKEDLKRYIESLLSQGGAHADVSMRARDAAARAVEASLKPDEVVDRVSRGNQFAPEQEQTLRKEVEIIQDMNENIKEFTDQDRGIRDSISKHASLYFDNPRDIKRFVNLFRFYYFLRAARLARKDRVPSVDQLCRWLAFTLIWPEVARWLRGRPTPQDGSFDAALKALERLGGASQGIAEWQTGMGKAFGLKPEDTGWLGDEDLRAFLNRENSEFKGEERLSSCGDGGLW